MTKIDKEQCIGCGACISVCPDGLEMGDDGKAKVKDESKVTKEAVEMCPVGAISE